MIDTDRRRHAADRLRRAITVEAYDEVQAALADYRREVEAAVAALQAHAPAAVDVVREAIDLTEWALRILRSARARTGSRLQQVSVVLRYHPSSRALPNWKLEG